MKKTTIQELIDWAISLQYNQQHCTDWIVIKDKAESLLEMEKQQTEISDEEIYKVSFEKESIDWHDGFIAGAKWYREQLKTK